MLNHTWCCRSLKAARFMPVEYIQEVRPDGRRPGQRGAGARRLRTRAALRRVLAGVDARSLQDPASLLEVPEESKILADHRSVG